MSHFLNIALDHISKGYPVFPCQVNKRPKTGLNAWENVATTDKHQIIAWWQENPDFLPAIPPGRVGMAVIDVDRHAGSEDGFKSLDDANIKLTSPVWGTSISGNGTHYWHRHDVGSVNGIYPGVDRKAQGGYVVVPYTLPPQSEVVTPLPEELQGGIKASNVERRNLTGRQLNIWLVDIGAGDPDEDMWTVVESFLPNGNQQMSIKVAKVVSLASQGHPGANLALDRMQEIWLDGVHNSGDPEEEFYANVRSAIEKFGEPAITDTIEETWKRLLTPPPKPELDIGALRDSLLQHCLTLRPDFLQLLQSNERVRNAFLKCDSVAKASIKTEKDAENWRTASKAAMGRVLAHE